MIIINECTGHGTTQIAKFILQVWIFCIKIYLIEADILQWLIATTMVMANFGRIAQAFRVYVLRFI